MNAAIRKHALFLALLALGLAAAPASAAEFAKSLSTAEIQSAGLAKLTPEELASLEALVQRYHQGDAAAGKKTSAPTAKPAKGASLLPDWVGALITLQHADKKPDRAQTLESRLTGNFSGWSGRSTFRLENGQLWAQATNEGYEYAPILPSPKVKIYPASFGSFWMEIEGVHQRCRVKPVSLD